MSAMPAAFSRIPSFSSHFPAACGSLFLCAGRAPAIPAYGECPDTFGVLSAS